MENKKAISYDFSCAIEKVGLPLVMTSANPRGLNFLIDSGSTHSILAESVYSKLKDVIQDVEEKLSVSGLEGIQKIVNRAQMELTICDIGYNVTFNIVDMSETFGNIKEETGVQLHGILGMDFLVENRWGVDFGNKVILIPIQKE